MKFIGICICITLTNNIFSQSFAINNDGSTANGSAILDVKSSTKGLLLPRMTKIQKNAISLPATGLLVFQTAPDSIGFHYYNGSQWLWLDPFVANTWKTTGNTGTDTATNFIGTTDNIPLHLKANNQLVQRLVPQRSNYFIGRGAGGLLNATSLGQIAIGDSAGANLTAIGSGVYIGQKAARNLINGPNNNVIGASAGLSLTSASFNNLFGVFAGRFLTTGTGNTILGHQAGDSIITSSSNTAVGMLALSKNKTGDNNTALGASANTGSDNLSNATAIGFQSQVDTSNALVLGSISGVNASSANVNVGIGTTKPKFPLHVSRGSSGSVLTNSNRIATFEDNISNYIQLLSPSANETGILAGNAETLLKSGIVFTNDSAIQLKTGCNNTRMIIVDTGNIGINQNFPSSILDLNGSFAMPIRIITSSATATLTATDHTVIINNSIVASIPIVLPLVTSTQGREYVIVNQNSFTHSTNFAYRDFNNTPSNSIPANTSITLQGSGAFWYRVR